MFETLRSDIRCILERDPAARSALEVLTCYPGLHAIFFHRLAHALWIRHWRWSARFVSYVSRWLTGVEIHPGAHIGNNVFIDHGMGLVIGETAVVGDGCTLYHGVTLGGTSLERGTKRHPTLGRNVVVSAGAKVLGGFIVGDDAKVGSNAVVTKPVPCGATAVGVPARIILRESHEILEGPATHEPFAAYAVTDTDDPLLKTLQRLVERESALESQVALLWKAFEDLAGQRSDDLLLPGKKRADTLPEGPSR